MARRVWELLRLDRSDLVIWYAVLAVQLYTMWHLKGHQPGLVAPGLPSDAVDAVYGFAAVMLWLQFVAAYVLLLAVIQWVSRWSASRFGTGGYARD